MSPTPGEKPVSYVVKVPNNYYPPRHDCSKHGGPGHGAHHHHMPAINVGPLEKVDIQRSRSPNANMQFNRTRQNYGRKDKYQKSPETNCLIDNDGSSMFDLNNSDRKRKKKKRPGVRSSSFDADQRNYNMKNHERADNLKNFVNTDDPNDRGSSQSKGSR